MASTLKKAANRGAAAPENPKMRRYGAALTTIKKRAEFQRLRGGVRWSGPAFLLEGKPRHHQDGDQQHGQPLVCGIRFGFTITKKIGKAHERNRMRRRLSHALRTLEIPPQLSNWDCVIVARRPAHDCAFENLVRDFEAALKRLARTPTPRAQALEAKQFSDASKPQVRDT
jgi:ribonuclease P protein component